MISKQVEEKIEEMGVYFAKAARPPMNGRVFGYLLMAEPPHKDFYEIQEALGASKSSISLALKSLQQSNLVDYITLKGNRRKQFKVNMSGWLGKSKEQILATGDLHKMLKSMLAERTDKAFSEFNGNLKMMIAFHQKLEKTMKNFIKDWEKTHKK